MSAAPWVEALAAILRGVPKLSGALCRGDARFTSEDPDDLADALEICHACPALDACKAWVTTLPRARIPVGVTAAQLNQPRPAGRPATKGIAR